jgi:flagellar protein FlaG
MESSLNLTSLKNGVYKPMAPSLRPTAPSGSEQLSMSPRQTAALLPTDLTPTDLTPAAPTEPEAGADDKQDVTDTKQEQTRLVEEARHLAEKANAYLRMADTHLEFTVSEQTGRVIISVVESDTKEVVRQIPPDSLNRFANRITQMRGLLFETTG